MNMTNEINSVTDIDKDNEYFDLIKMLESEENETVIELPKKEVSLDWCIPNEYKSFSQNVPRAKTANVAPLRATVAPIRNETIMSSSSSNMNSSKMTKDNELISQSTPMVNLQPQQLAMLNHPYTNAPNGIVCLIPPQNDQQLFLSTNMLFSMPNTVPNPPTNANISNNSMSLASNSLPKLLPKPQSIRQPTQMHFMHQNQMSTGINPFIQQYQQGNALMSNQLNSFTINNLHNPTNINNTNKRSNGNGACINRKNNNSRSRANKSGNSNTQKSNSIKPTVKSQYNVNSTGSTNLNPTTSTNSSSTTSSFTPSTANASSIQAKDNFLLAWEYADNDSTIATDSYEISSTSELSALESQIVTVPTTASNPYFLAQTVIIPQLDIIKYQPKTFLYQASITTNVNPTKSLQRCIIRQPRVHMASGVAITVNQTPIEYLPAMQIVNSNIAPYNLTSGLSDNTVLQLLYHHFTKHNNNQNSSSNNVALSPSFLKYFLPNNTSDINASNVNQLSIEPSNEDDDYYYYGLNDYLSPNKHQSSSLMELAKLDQLLERSARSINNVTSNKSTVVSTNHSNLLSGAVTTTNSNSNTSNVPYQPTNNEDDEDNYDEEEDEDDEDDDDDDYYDDNDQDDDNNDNNNNDNSSDSNIDSPMNNRRKCLPYQLPDNEQLQLQQYLNDMQSNIWLKRTKNKNKWLQNNESVKIGKTLENSKAEVTEVMTLLSQSVVFSQSRHVLQKKHNFQEQHLMVQHHKIQKKKRISGNATNTNIYQVKIDKIKRANKKRKSLLISSETEVINSAVNISDNTTEQILMQPPPPVPALDTDDNNLGNWKIDKPPSSGTLKIRLKLQQPPTQTKVKRNNISAPPQVSTQIDQPVKPTRTPRTSNSLPRPKFSSPANNNKRKRPYNNKRKTTMLPSSNVFNNNIKHVPLNPIIMPNINTTTNTAPIFADSKPSPKKIFCTRKEDRRSSAILHKYKSTQSVTSSSLSINNNATTLYKSRDQKEIKSQSCYNPPIILKVSQSKLKSTVTSTIQEKMLSTTQQPSPGPPILPDTTPPILQNNVTHSSGSMKLRIKRTSLPSSHRLPSPSQHPDLPSELSPSSSPPPPVLVNQLALPCGVSSGGHPHIPINFSPTLSITSDEDNQQHNEISNLLQRQDQLDPLLIASMNSTSDLNPKTSFSNSSSANYLVGSSPTVFIDRNKVDLIVVKNTNYKKSTSHHKHHQNSSNPNIIHSSSSDLLDITTSTSSNIKTTFTTVSSSIPAGTCINSSIATQLHSSNDMYLPGCFIDSKPSNSPKMPILAPQEPSTMIQQKSPLCMTIGNSNSQAISSPVAPIPPAASHHHNTTQHHSSHHHKLPSSHNIPAVVSSATATAISSSSSAASSLSAYPSYHHSSTVAAAYSNNTPSLSELQHQQTLYNAAINAVNYHNQINPSGAASSYFDNAHTSSSYHHSAAFNPFSDYSALSSSSLVNNTPPSNNNHPSWSNAMVAEYCKTFNNPAAVHAAMVAANNPSALSLPHHLAATQLPSHTTPNSISSPNLSSLNPLASINDYTNPYSAYNMPAQSYMYQGFGIHK